MTSDEVVGISLKCLKKKNKVICVPGLRNKFLSTLLKIMPASMYYKLMESIFNKSGKNKGDSK